VAQCSGKKCGADGCGGTCGTCASGSTCQSGSCVANCGNGVKDSGEACDDGNNVDTDSCVHCQNAFCGDGYVQLGVEECDAGARGWSGKCDALCKRMVYQQCQTTSECSGVNDNCAQWSGAGGPLVCAPYCESDAACPTVPDLALPDFTAVCNFAYCGIVCKNRACPSKMVCAPNISVLDHSGNTIGTRDICVVAP
jgi:cysteine-rich repeat protein